MDSSAMGGMAIITIGVLVGVLAATRLAVRSAPMRLGLYAISGAALAVTLAGLMLLIPAGVTIGAPPIGALVLLAVAIGAGVAILWLALRNEWLTNWAGRAGAGLSIYVILLVAFPPAMPGAWLAAGAALAGLMLVVWWLSRPQAATAPAAHAAHAAGTINAYQADYEFEEVEDGEWIIEPIGAGAAGALIGDDDGGLREPQRDEDSGGAGEVGPSEVRLPDAAGESGRAISAGSGSGGGSASAGGGADRRGTGQQPNGNRAGAGENGARDGVVVYPAVAAPYRPAVRRGRGRRLAGALVPGQVAPGDGAGASAGAGAYDAAGAAVMASIAPAA